MITCLGSMVTALPMCLAAPGNVPERTEKKSHLCRREIWRRLTLPSVTPRSVSSAWGVGKPGSAAHLGAPTRLQAASGNVPAASGSCGWWVPATASPQPGCCRRCCDCPSEHLCADQLQMP